MSSQVQLESTWKTHLLPEFDKSYMKNLKSFLQEELKRNKRIYPPGPQYFNAFILIVFEKSGFHNMKIVSNKCG